MIKIDKSELKDAVGKVLKAATWIYLIIIVLIGINGISYFLARELFGEVLLTKKSSIFLLLIYISMIIVTLPFGWLYEAGAKKHVTGTRFQKPNRIIRFILLVLVAAFIILGFISMFISKSPDYFGYPY